jgi:hypothetical protein
MAATVIKGSPRIKCLPDGAHTWAEWRDGLIFLVMRSRPGWDGLDIDTLKKCACICFSTLYVGKRLCILLCLWIRMPIVSLPNSPSSRRVL